VRLLAESFNTLFRVDLHTRSRRVLRVSPEVRIHQPAAEDLEATWMAEIREQTSIAVPAVRRNNHGEVVTSVRVPGVDGERTCVMFDWVPGVPLRLRADPESMCRAGLLLAELHEQASGRGDNRPPTGTLVADRVLPFADDDLLNRIWPRFGALVDEARARAQSSIDALWAEPPHHPHLLHGDFTWHNLFADRDQVTVIDFQDHMYGFDVIDVVTALYPLELGKDAQPLGDAFCRGYRQVRRWPVGDAELFGALVAARRIMQINLGLNLRKPGLDEHIERLVRPLARWLRDGPEPELRSRLSS